MKKKAIDERRKVLDKCDKVVIKAGTRLLTDIERIGKLIESIAALRKRGMKVLLVSSGAVGLGMKALKMSRRPRKLADVQALAAIGQGKLMSLYDAECRKHGFSSAQLLLTAADLRSRERHLNALNCIDALWAHDVLPIVNENDSVSVDSLKFGDNDFLAGLLGAMLKAPLTIILTTESGLRERDENGELGERISVVPKIADEHLAAAQGTDNAELSVGGMSSKLRAAATVTAAGEHLIVADGREEGILEKIFAGEDVGTLFLPGKDKMHSRKRFLKFFAHPDGKIVVDGGAASALKERGKSLLPSGIRMVEGEFKAGDTVEIVAEKDGLFVARGIVNFSAAECSLLIGAQCSEICERLGREADEEVVHRNNLII